MVYPHESSCYVWDGQERLVCTFACRQHHPRRWKIRREQAEGCGCLPGKPYWTIYRLAGAAGYQSVGGADSFDRALAMLNQPMTLLGAPS